MSSVSSPPTTTTGRRMHSQRRSYGRVGDDARRRLRRAAMGTWLTGSNIVMIWPSTSSACGMYISLAERPADALPRRRSCRCPARRRGRATCRSSPPGRAARTSPSLTIRSLKPVASALAVDVRPRRHARPHVGVVLRERHRRRADVARDVEELHGAIASEIGQRVAIAGAAGAAGAAHLDELLDPRVLDQRLEHASTAAAGSRRARCRSLRRRPAIFSSSCVSVSG